jgi:hypothetical protein
MMTKARFKILQRLSLTSLTLWATHSVCADQPATFLHEGTDAEYSSAVELNAQEPLEKNSPIGGLYPSIDTAPFKYVLMSSETQGSSEVTNLRNTIAANLPTDVKLIILASTSDAASERRRYERYISSERLIIATSNDPYVDNGFWARDSFPVPVWNPVTGQASLVALKYYRTFNAQADVAHSVNAPFASYNKVFVGGNILADENGRCFSVNSRRLYGMTPEDIKSIYSCTSLQMMEHLAGIGDVDEVLKPLGAGKVLTNQIKYKSVLEGLGYTVTMLPDIGGYRTYANALIVGKTVFMPSYGVSQDNDAKAVYEGLGYNVTMIRSNSLSDDMHGSIHCQTMAYPQLDQASLFKSLNVHEVK